MSEKNMYRLSLVGGVVLILLVISDFAEAQGNADIFDSNSSAVSNSSSRAETFNENVSSSVAKGGFGEGGSAEATGGESSSNNALTINDREVRQAPSVALVAPSGTAPLMKCIGVGGSNETGSAVIGHCWLQRDLYAEHRAQGHIQAKRYQAATTALCSKKLYRSDFESREACEAQTYQSFIDLEIEKNNASIDEIDLAISEQRAIDAEAKAQRLEGLLNEFTGGKTAKK